MLLELALIPCLSNDYAVLNFSFLTSRRSMFFFACHRLYASCIASQLSGERPSVLESRSAISGETLFSALTRRLNVEGETFSFSATLRELILKGVK